MMISKSQNIVYAYNYPKKQEVTILLSDWRRRKEKAFSTMDVGRLLNRNRSTMHRYIETGAIKEPYRIIPEKGWGVKPSGRGPKGYFWSETEVYNLHELCLSVPQGKPRKDGKHVSSSTLPTKAQLKSMIGSGIVTYVQNSKGEFVPAWKEPTF